MGSDVVRCFVEEPPYLQVGVDSGSGLAPVWMSGPESDGRARLFARMTWLRPFAVPRWSEMLVLEGHDLTGLENSVGVRRHRGGSVELRSTLPRMTLVSAVPGPMRND
jgi:hypothetical protein